MYLSLCSLLSWLRDALPFISATEIVPNSIFVPWPEWKSFHTGRATWHQFERWRFSLKGLSFPIIYVLWEGFCLFALNQSFAALVQLYTRFGATRVVFMWVLLALQFQVWGDLFFQLPSSPMCSMLCCRMCVVNKDNRNLSFGFYLKERAVN